MSGFLDKFRFDVYSQSGEDGVIHFILNQLRIIDGISAEFGAYDGIEFSNTRFLLEKGFTGYFIEYDDKHYHNLVSNMDIFGNRAICLHKKIDIDGENTFDSIMSQFCIPEDFSVLSIDVDSWDWHIWYSIQKYKPIIVVIEINSSIPPGIIQTHRHHPNFNGTSFSAMVQLGKKKGYTPVCHTGNLIFVDDAVVRKLNMPAIEYEYPELLFNYSSINLKYY